ncbi:unnamed protein product [Chrysoparadoxa australica]
MAALLPINARDDFGCTAIHRAAKAGDLTQTEELIRARADLETRENQHGCTPLILAIQGGHVECIRALIKGKARVNSRGGGGKTPLHWACLSGNAAVAKLLLRSGAEVNAKDGVGLTPLLCAVQSADGKDCVMTVIEAKAKVKAVNAEGLTALHFAARRGWLDVVQLLLAAGAQPGVQSKTGETPAAFAQVGWELHPSDYATVMEQEKSVLLATLKDACDAAAESSANPSQNSKPA